MKAQSICFGEALVKKEGESVNFVGYAGAPQTEEQEDMSEWIELRYDPSDEIAEPLFEAMIQLIEASIFNDATEENIETVITKLAYLYCRD